MSHSKKRFVLTVDDRELATILAGLRFHQDENLRIGSGVPDSAVKEIVADCGSLKPLDFDEVDELCERVNSCEEAYLTFAPPPNDFGENPLFRVVYAIDVEAVDAQAAAEYTYRIMTDPDSMPPVFEIIDHEGETVMVDLSENQNYIQENHHD